MSLDTKNFKTRTIYKEKKNPIVEGYWPIALDIGYSAVKGISPNSVYSFPYFAIQVNRPLISLPYIKESEILYKDEQGVLWIVGESAQDMITTDDTNISESGMFTRHRFASPMFRVVSRVGLALGMIKNELGDPDGKKVHIQTGLPPKYMSDEDKEALKDALTGIHKFQVKIGQKAWTHIELEIRNENIDIMAQSMGTLFSVAYDNDAQFVKGFASIFQSDILIFDFGFGKLDVFHIKNRSRVNTDTFTDLGMRRVFEETSKLIQLEYKVNVPVVSMQKSLGDGYVKQFNRKERKVTKKPFGDLLEKASKTVCREALERIDYSYNDLSGQDYLIVTGGTGAAWYNYIVEHYKEKTELKIIPGNRNDKLPYIFANARGYYLAIIYGIRTSK